MLNIKCIKQSNMEKSPFKCISGTSFRILLLTMADSGFNVHGTIFVLRNLGWLFLNIIFTTKTDTTWCNVLGAIRQIKAKY